MRRANTRNRLLDAALEQFGERGYGGTSIRSLAGAVGVRESSVYKHFTNKRSLWEAVVSRTTDNFDRDARSLARRLGTGPDEPVALRRLEFLAQAVFEFYAQEPSAVALRRLLVVAQNQAPEVGVVLRDRCAKLPLRLLADEFVKSGIGHDAAELWALELWGPIYLLLDLAVDDAPAARALLHHHVVEFHRHHPFSPDTHAAAASNSSSVKPSPMAGRTRSARG